MRNGRHGRSQRGEILASSTASELAYGASREGSNRRDLRLRDSGLDRGAQGVEAPCSSRSALSRAAHNEPALVLAHRLLEPKACGELRLTDRPAAGSLSAEHRGWFTPDQSGPSTKR